MNTEEDMFKFHKLNKLGIANVEVISGHFINLLGTLKVFCPEGREFSIVKTKLEEACFFAKKAIAIQPENQENV